MDQNLCVLKKKKKSVGSSVRELSNLCVFFLDVCADSVRDPLLFPQVCFKSFF